MSSDYFFEKWKKSLQQLELVTVLDMDNQEPKANDKELCEATRRISEILASYINVCNDLLDCVYHNWQPQKTVYMQEIIQAVIYRISELKNKLIKLEGSNIHFFGESLINRKLTTFDIELSLQPTQTYRPPHWNSDIDQIFRKAEAKNIEIEMEIQRRKELEENPPEEKIKNVFDDEDEKETAVVIEIKPEPKEVLEKRHFAAIIQAHERTRQITQWKLHQYIKRQRWIKLLTENNEDEPKIDIKQAAAKLIQMTFRKYFEIKRQRILESKIEDILDMRMKRVTDQAQSKSKEFDKIRRELVQKYKDDWTGLCKEIKDKYLKRKKEDILDDCRDHLRYWFQEWYNSIRFIHSIPPDTDGGSTKILYEEIPSPGEWQIQYEEYLAKKKADAKKTPEELKDEKMQGKKEAAKLKKAEAMKMKAEAALLRKIMKNPKMHPGYFFDRSTKTDDIIELLKKYHVFWDDYDAQNIMEVKKGTIEIIIKNNMYQEVKKEIRIYADDDMREEYKVLKKVLKEAYDEMEEIMPEEFDKPKRKRKKKIKASLPCGLTDKIVTKLEDLALKHIIREYQRHDFQDFIGDPNFAGDDLRCQKDVPIKYFGAETRALWWNICREANYQSQRVLLVGPRGSGKTMLIDIMANTLNSILYQLDLYNIPPSLQTPAYFQYIVDNVALCAKATQPSIIHLRHVQKYFNKKKAPEDQDLQVDIIKNFFIKRLFKKINKTDNITVIATCVSPWLTRSAQLMKKFPHTVMMPEANYTTIVKILNKWLQVNHTLPQNFDVQSLAFMLQGYSFGAINNTLIDFLTADRLVKIAATGLFPADILNFFLDQANIERVDYQEYMDWYYTMTEWGKKEMAKLEHEREFKEAKIKLAESIKKKKMIR